MHNFIRFVLCYTGGSLEHTSIDCRTIIFLLRTARFTTSFTGCRLLRSKRAAQVAPALFVFAKRVENVITQLEKELRSTKSSPAVDDKVFPHTACLRGSRMRFQAGNERDE